MYFRLLRALYFMLLGRIWEWQPIWMQVKKRLRLWLIMVILFVYLVICNLHVQQKSIRANLSARHSKLPSSMYFKLLRASYFILLSQIWEWRPILNVRKKWLHIWQIMVILFAYLVIYNSHVKKNISIRANLLARHSKLPQPIYPDFHIKILDNQNNEQCNHNF